MRAALLRPKLFQRVVNIHSPARPERRLQLLSAGLRSRLARRALSKVIERDPEKWAHRNVHYHDETLKSVEEAQQYGAPLTSEEGRRAFIGYLARALEPRDLAGFVSQLEHNKRDNRPFPVPLHLIYSRRDALVSPRNGDFLAKLVPRAELSWIDDSSHFAHVDTPERVAALIRQ